MVEEHRNSECPLCYLVGQSRHRGEEEEEEVVFTRDNRGGEPRVSRQYYVNGKTG